MGEAFKNLYTRELIEKIGDQIKVEYSDFKRVEFVDSILDETWEGLELKARTNYIAANLRKFLPQDYKSAITIIDKVIVHYGNWLDGLVFFFPTFVELYGTDDWETSVPALARYTRYASSEFAVRPFIIDDQKRMMAQMYEWSKSDCEHVRRLSSEGCRPLLPWGQILQNLKADPSPILPILEQLKNDADIYVRKSVANNLNDISKNHPELVIKIAKDWYGQNEKINWIVKHGCRTLLKQSNKDALALFGLGDAGSVQVSDLGLVTASIKIGEDNSFSFTIEALQATKVRLEYGVDYVKANGKRNRKVFQISEISLKQGERKNYTRKHSFADVSIRRHYPGIHSFTLIVNGVERGTLDFQLNV
ncbi:MAG: DNA alkylation repair protein [Firmicutes bacterium]|nr:DNA alkylation repair protein [Bacillota bacterium]